MTIFKVRFLGMAVLAFVVAACGGTAETSNESNPRADADNTARNVRDKSEETKTPLDQGENEQDLQISANIRKAIRADDSLSTNAHNVKIVTNAGTVTLRGPVENANEKNVIEAKAKQVAGVQRVENLLEITASN
jgi:osmotically-inducible protein OsmY